MKKTKKANRALALVLAGAMALGLVGCRGGGQAASGGGAASGGSAGGAGGAVSGSWQQQEVTPDASAFVYNTPVLQPDGGLLLLEKKRDDSVSLWHSGDNGATWQETPTDWLAQTGAEYVGLTCLLPDGRCFFAAASGTGGARSARYYLAGADGALTELTLPESIEDLSSAFWLGGDRLLILGRTPVPASEGVPEILLDENGMMRVGAAWVLDLASGACAEEPGFAETLNGSYISGMALDGSGPAGSFYRMSFAESGTNLVLRSADGVDSVVFQNLPDASSAAFAACGDAEGNYYYASEKGIYRVAKGGSIAEKVVEGSGTVMAQRSNTLMGLARAADGSFLVYANGSAGGDDGVLAVSLYRFYWDETAAPAAPSGDALVVWSLEDQNTVRAAIDAYKARNPGKEVVYQIGLESAAGREDALTALNAAMLAGAGPDVLFLDDLDWQVYARQGLLADLTGVVEINLLQNGVASSFQDASGAVWTLPARFAVPVLSGAAADLDAIGSLEDLAAAVLARPARPAFDLNSAQYYEQMAEPYALGFVSAEQLLDFALESSAPALLTDSGVDSAAVRRLLDFVQQVGTYYGMENYTGLSSNGVVGGDMGSDPVEYGDGGYECYFTHNAAFGWDTVETASYLAAANGDGFATAARPGLVEGAFLPRAMAAISASAAHGEDAERFVQALFSEEVQGVFQQDGFPALASALAQSVRKNCGGDPEAETRAMELLESLETPVTMPDPAVYDALLEQTNALVGGKTTLDEAVAGVEHALTLYLAERQ